MKNIRSMCSLELDVKGNVKPTYVNLVIEGISISFEADTGFANVAISEKLCLKYFKEKTAQR